MISNSSFDAGFRISEVYSVRFGEIPGNLWKGDACDSAAHFKEEHRYSWPDYDLTDDFELMATHFELVEIMN